MHLTIRRSLVVMVLTVLLSGAAAFGQEAEGEGNQGFKKTKGELYILLQKYPPRLGEILKMDHSLLTNESYLGPYPDLRKFLEQHPEVLRDPGSFIGDSQLDQFRTSVIVPNNYDYRRSPLEEFFDALFPLTIFLTVVIAFIWIIRNVADHRRWLRVWRAHSEAHSKLMDRLTNNEDMLAYLQTPAGKRFFESSSMPVDFTPTTRASLPAGRILWSVQVGLVLLLGGLSFQFVRIEGLQPAEQGVMTLISVLGIGLGISFVIGAIASYMISAKLGLLEESARRSPSNIEPPAST